MYIIFEAVDGCVCKHMMNVYQQDGGDKSFLHRFLCTQNSWALSQHRLQLNPHSEVLDINNLLQLHPCLRTQIDWRISVPVKAWDTYENYLKETAASAMI